MRGAFLMRCPSALAGDFPLLLRRHRRKPAALFPFTSRSTPQGIIHGSTLVLLARLPWSRTT
jgi:hypothetical protein